MFAGLFGYLFRRSSAKRIFAAQGGAVAPMTALMLVPILGAMALAVDVGYWYKTQRSMQSAADSAALAAAFSDDANYAGAAKGTATRLGYTDGTGSVTVVPERNGSVLCPTGVTGTCTKVTITDEASLWFAPIVGILGNANGKQGLMAVAIARQSGAGGPASLCLTAYGTSGVTPAIQANGVPFANMAGCSIFSNNNMNCSGNNLGADYGIAVGTNTGCGITSVTGATPVADSFAALASNIPALKAAPCQPSNNLSGNYTWSGTIHFCGNVTLTGNVTLNPPPAGSADPIIVVDNGVFDTARKAFQSAAGAHATMIFTGTNASASSHYPTGQSGGPAPGSTLDINAPTTGTWKGIAIYQDPALTNNVSFTYAGNAPTWNITGMVYLPHASLTLSGAIGKSSNGYNCFALAVDNITINGTGNIFANPQSQCNSAGLTPPSTNLPGGGNPWLIQ